MRTLKKSKILLLALAVALVLLYAAGCGSSTPPADTTPAPDTSAPTDTTQPSDTAKNIGFYADAADSYYSLMNDALTALAKQDPECNWNITYKAGQSTADEQLNAVNDFITAKYDAIIVIQNNPNTTSECIQKCKDAGIPYFGAAHYFGDEPNAADSTGSTNYDFLQGGYLAGQDAIAHGVTKLIMIEGVLGQGSAGDQSLGFLQAYQDAGKNLGTKADGTPWTANDLATIKPSVSDIKGNPDFEVVSWKSGNWMTDAAQTAMQDSITALGQNGWDGAYVQNDPMVEGAINAMTAQGLSTEDYWLGSMNGREVSWQWAKDGTISMDVNQPSTMEGALLYQMLKEYFATGTVSRPHVHPYMTAYTKDNINDVIDTLVPATDVNAFIDGVNSNKFVWKIDDPKFLDIQGY